MAHPLLATRDDASVPIWLVTAETWPGVGEHLSPQARAFAKAQGFEAKSGTHCLLPNPDGTLLGVLFGLDGKGAKQVDPFLPGKLATILPEGTYRFEGELPEPALATLAWLLGSYSFTRYKSRPAKSVRLVAPGGVDAGEVALIAQAVCASRDLINTPTNDLGPDGIEAAARQLADRHGASFTSIVGDDLLTKNFPMIHAVGRASATPPRLIDVSWGPSDAPKITFVGKGVAFDTGST